MGDKLLTFVTKLVDCGLPIYIYVYVYMCMYLLQISKNNFVWRKDGTNVPLSMLLLHWSHIYAELLSWKLSEASFETKSLTWTK